MYTHDERPHLTPVIIHQFRWRIIPQNTGSWFTKTLKKPLAKLEWNYAFSDFM